MVLKCYHIIYTPTVSSLYVYFSVRLLTCDSQIKPLQIKLSTKARTWFCTRRGFTVHRADYHRPIFVHNADLLSVGIPAHTSNHRLISVVDHLFIPGAYLHK